MPIMHNAALQKLYFHDQQSLLPVFWMLRQVSCQEAAAQLTHRVPCRPFQ